MTTITWADAMVRFAEDRLIVGREFAALFAGIGIEPSKKFTPDQIIESMDLDVIPLTAAKLAAKADGTRSENDWIFDALKLIDWVRDHHLLPWSQGQPLPIEMRRAAVGIGLIADVSAGMIRNKMMEPLVPIVNRPITLAELYAAGGFDEQGQPIATRPE